MIAYLDTSVILRPLLGQGKSLDLRNYQAAYSSEILGLEARRVLDRLRLEAALDDAGVAEAHQELARIEGFLGYVPFTPLVLRRASMPMPTIVKTLDAIHLTSALLLRDRKGGDMVFATHDFQQATAARAFDFEVVGA